MAPLALVFVLTLGQPRPLGRSHAQILAMGHARWRAVVAREGGTSRADYANGEWDYGEAAAWRNARVLARTRRPAYGALVHDLRAFRGHAVGVGDAVDGGSTAWSTVWCETHADLEEALGAVLTGRAKSARGSASSVERPLRELETAVERAVARSSGEGLGLYVRRSKGELTALNAAWKVIEADGRRLPRVVGASRSCCRAVLAKVLRTL